MDGKEREEYAITGIVLRESCIEKGLNCYVTSSPEDIHDSIFLFSKNSAMQHLLWVVL
jgi:hypothetical protein